MNKYLLIISLSFVIFGCKQQQNHLKRIEGDLVPITSKTEKDVTITHTIAPFKAKLEGEMNAVLAYSPADLYKDKGKSETAIGNFMADLCYKRSNPLFHKQSGKDIDFVLLNYGGIRSGIAKGAVTTKTAFELMPFENSIVVVELKSQKLQELFEYLRKSGLAHPISKQLKIVIDNDKITSVLINGKEIDKNKSYFVLTSDYLQRGGDRMYFFANPLKLYDLNYKIRSAILDEFTEIDTIKAKEDGRFIRRIKE